MEFPGELFSLQLALATHPALLKLEKAKGGLEVPRSRFPVCEAAGAWEGGVNFLSRPPDWKASLCLQYLINKVTFIMLRL